MKGVDYCNEEMLGNMTRVRQGSYVSAEAVVQDRSGNSFLSFTVFTRV